jgi:Na+/H+ antiporter NhaA
MMTASKLVGLIATIGFSRAVFVCSLCLLVVHVVTFEEFVILVLFGFAMDGVSVRRVSPRKQKVKSVTDWDAAHSLKSMPPERNQRTL